MTARPQVLLTTRRVLAALAMLAPPLALAVNVLADKPASLLETSYGRLSVRAAAGRTELLLNDKVASSFNAEGAELFRIASKGPREFVIVQALRFEPRCRYAYSLMALTPAGLYGSPIVGVCSELVGAGFYGSDPVFHLKASKGGESAVTSYQWKDDELVKLLESPSLCSAEAFLAQKNAQPIAQALQARRASGEGRLQFMSAPDSACAMHGVFVVPGDHLKVSLQDDGFVYASYTNPKSGRKVEGWVVQERVPAPP